jgi:hypothetical protein
MGVLEASEAVSGCNILILPIYASVLRPSRGAALTSANNQYWPSPARLAPPNLISAWDT